MKFNARELMREYGLYFALITMMLAFNALTRGVFLSSRNISNMIDQTGYIAVLAIGMTLVLVIREIDLSVGFVAGTVGAVLALALRSHLAPIPFLILGSIGFGALIGAVNGLLVTKLDMPSWIVSLAGMFVFRGVLLLLTEGSGTIIVDTPFFVALGNGFIPDFLGGTAVHRVTIAGGTLAAAAVVFGSVRARREALRYDVVGETRGLFLGRMVVLSALIMYLAWKLSQYHGFSWTLVTVAVVAVAYHFILSRTLFGRHVRAVGFNLHAAELSGIRVKRIVLAVLTSMGALSALAGILFTSRLMAAQTTAGTGFEMDAIASAYIGGVSAAGGIGTITGTLIGALFISALSSGMNLLQMGISVQYMVKGAVLVLAVLLDIRMRGR